jgi:hypothetical protein
VLRGTSGRTGADLVTGLSRIYALTFHIWDPVEHEYNEEKFEYFSDGMPPLPLIGEEVWINISEPGTLVECRAYTVVRRAFEYTTGSVVLPDIPGQTVIESVGVSLYVNKRTQAVPRDVAPVP